MPPQSVPAAGGTFSFLTEAGFLDGPPTAGQSLDIESVNVNGSPCGRVGGGASLTYGACASPRLALAADGPAVDDPAPVVLLGADGGGGAAEGCWAQFCCGVVLLDPSLLQPPPSPPVADPPALQPAPGLPPPPPAELSGQAPPASAGPAPAELPGATLPASPAAEDPGKGGGGVMVPAAAGGGGAAAVLLLGGGLLLLFRRRRRRIRQQQQQREEEALRAAAVVKAELIAAEASITSAVAGGSSTSSPASSPGGAAWVAPSPGPLGCPTLASILSPVTLLAQPSGSGAVPSRAASGTSIGCQVSIAPVGAAAGHLKAGDADSERGVVDRSGSAGSSPPGRLASRGSRGSGGSGAGASLLSDGSVDLARDVALFEQLGSGAFGVVYRGKGREMGQGSMSWLLYARPRRCGRKPRCLHTSAPGSIPAGEWQGRPVAVKVLQTACGSRSRELESFRQEARVLAGLRHPNIVCLLAACTGAWGGLAAGAAWCNPGMQGC